MATFETRYTTTFDYAKHVNSTGAVTVINRLNQQNNQTFPLIHAADVSIGDDESLENRLNIKLQTIDAIFRDIYGVAPSILEAYTDGRSTEELAALAADSGTVGATGLTGMASFARIAQILNNRTETVDDRIKDLKLFKTVSVSSTGASTADLTAGSAATNLISDNNKDTLGINSENKWIILTANNTTDSFTIGHYKKDFTPTTSTLNLNNSATFDIINLTYDEAGHIIAKDTKTLTLPYNYKTITLQNAEATAVSELTANSTSVIADSQVATIKYIAGNKWIKFAGANDENNKSITFAHSLSPLAAGAHVSSYDKTAQTPSFGSSVNILIPIISFTTDEAGHVTAYEYTAKDTTITIPKGSLSVDTTNNAGNVITDIGFTDTTGALIKHLGYIGDLLLTNYAAPNLPTGYVAATGVGDKKVYSSIAASQSLNAALAQLQSYAYNNQAIVDTHIADTNNPHSVTKEQIGLSNVDNIQQIQALSGRFNSENVGHVALWQANNVLSISNYTIGCSVPSDAVFTDTTYEQATNSNLGLVKLYGTTGSHTDGTMTQAAIDQAIVASVQNILDNFDLEVSLPKTVEWSVNSETNELIATLDSEYENVITTIQKFVDGDWTEVEDLTETRVSGDKFRLYCERTITIGGKDYSNAGAIGEEYIEE